MEKETIRSILIFKLTVIHSRKVGELNPLPYPLMLNNCAIHTLILSQTFSIAECEFLLRHAEKFFICESCKAAMQKKIDAAITESAGDFRNCNSLPDGQTGPHQTAKARNSMHVRKK